MVQQAGQLRPRWSRWLAGACILTSVACLAAPQARAYTAVFTFTGRGNVGNTSIVNSWSVDSDGSDPTNLVISSQNGGGFRVVNADTAGLCAYFSANTGNSSACNTYAGTSYNGLTFTLQSSQNIYNVKLTSITIGQIRFGSYTDGGATNTIISTFSGAAGSSGVYAQLPALGTYNFGGTPITADAANSIRLCSTPDINGLSCTDNIVSGNNGITNTSFYTISNMTFTYDTPTPLPILGAGAAFGWSRRLRRRISQARVRATARSAG